ncbi:MAG: precorrin-3B C(17)-methyltransferase [Salinivirgaceae bacterium]|jgi:precorrin-3B C17-methyltransferase|nr:precorrin-3B C(17)-methyltransferase [Salinivirgaceae bacterium]
MSGKIYVVGTGPGSKDFICPVAIKAMENSDVIVGYKTYIKLVEPFIQNKELVSSSMMKEVERCEEVLRLAETGKTISLISSGDPGVYGMAGVMLEVVAAKKSAVEVEIIPGISAASSSASLLGAPLMNDYVVLSLSDLLTPWELIIKRLHAAGSGDFVVSIYNPRSKKRIQQLDTAIDILLEYQNPETPVGIVKHAMREKQEVIITDLANLKQQDVDMFTTVIIGNSQTKVIDNKMVTIRGYKV